MPKSTAGAIATAAGIAVVLVAHPPYPIPYVFESVSMALFLPLVATALTVAGGIIVARDAEVTTARPVVSLAVDFAPLWAVAVVVVYLTVVPGFGLTTSLVPYSLALGFVAGLLVAITNRL